MAVLTYRAVELRDLTVRRCWFGLVAGWHDGIGVRFEDVVYPGKPGQGEGERVADERVLRLHGVVVGTDPTNWKAVLAELEAIFDPTLASGALVVTTPYLGLTAGTRTIEARVANYRAGIVVPEHVTEVDITLHALGDPPDWS